MSKLNMTRITVLLLCLVAVVQCQRQKLCKHEYNIHSPLYWRGEEDMCTDELCQKYPELRCNDYNETSLAEQVALHYGPEDILAEVAAMQKYFDTYLPDNLAQPNYACEGVCDRGPTLLKRVLTTLDVFDYETETYIKKRWMCHVVGPKIYQRECRGRCKALYGNPNMFCVPEVTVSIDIWVFCPEIHQGCRRIRTEVPLSCACKEIQCLAAPPPGPLPPPWLPEGVSTPNGQINFGPTNLGPGLPKNVGGAGK